MFQSTPLTALLGGMLIGLSATLMLLLYGRIAGISGIFALAVDPKTTVAERSWRIYFIGGLFVAGLLFHDYAVGIPAGSQGPVAQTLAAGVLVGFGTRLGSGCTSGHGVCGISRLSPRSIVATLTFVLAGALAVWLTGGAS